MHSYNFIDFDNLAQFNTASVDVIGIALSIDYPSGQSEESNEAKRAVVALIDDKGRKLEVVYLLLRKR